VDKERYYSQFDYNLVRDKSKGFELINNSILINELLTGHLIAFDDHFKIFESTDVDDHDLSSSRRTLPFDFFVQVLKTNLIKKEKNNGHIFITLVSDRIQLDR
jgi:ribosomal protein L16 Arg81 hydroxylase